MSQPAPARFAAAERAALRVSLATGLGPLATLAALIVGYALSAHDCQAGMRPLIAACISAAALCCLGAIYELGRRGRSARPDAAGRLGSAAIALQVFCLFVLAGFCLASATQVRCD
jgi:hypothetical protein